MDNILSLHGLEGINQKADLASVIGSPSVGTDAFATLVQAIQTQKNTMATNLTAKGQSAVGTETIKALADKIASVDTGKKRASGSFQCGSGTNTISGLSFTPSTILANLPSQGRFGVFSTLSQLTGFGNGTSSKDTNFYVSARRAGGFDIYSAVSPATCYWEAIE